VQLAPQDRKENKALLELVLLAQRVQVEAMVLLVQPEQQDQKEKTERLVLMEALVQLVRLEQQEQQDQRVQAVMLELMVLLEVLDQQEMTERQEQPDHKVIRAVQLIG
jgi:hypothetical protein